LIEITLLHAAILFFVKKSFLKSMEKEVKFQFAIFRNLPIKYGGESLAGTKLR
jgi:hypothetical protein